MADAPYRPDPPAATPGLRTLGSGATQAAPGSAFAVVLHNLTATAAPAVGNDSSQGYGAGSLWLDATSGVMWVCLSPSVGAAVWRPLSPLQDVQIFTSSATWTIPSWTASVPSAYTRLILLNGGAGAGSGARRASGTATSGGGAGAGGGLLDWTYETSTLVSGAITIGAGGAGGAAQTVNDSNGNAGSQGGISSAAILATGGSIKNGFATNAGSGGNTGAAPGGSGGPGGTGSTSAGAGGVVGAAGSNGNGQPGIAGAGGGAGGGISATPAAFAGGNGGYRQGGTQATPVGAAINTSASQPTYPTYGSLVWGGVVVGSGGAGGGASITGAGGSGANGQNYGAGGGGGGSSLNGFNSGAGGAGAGGFGILITWAGG